MRDGVRGPEGGISFLEGKWPRVSVILSGAANMLFPEGRRCVDGRVGGGEESGEEAELTSTLRFKESMGE